MNFESWMQTLAAQQDDPSPLPSASAIYWRAELRRRTEAGERALLPVRRMEWVACAVFVVTAIAAYF